MAVTRRQLNAEQRRVVDHDAGPMCVLGGAGTGKTTVLEERFVRLALAPESSPDRILFLVPNRTQKIELVDRLTRRLLFDEGLDALVDVPVYTWHGLAYHLVTRHYDRLAYSEPPVLLTSPEQWGDVREALEKENEANWPHHRHLLGNRGFVDEVVDFCIRAEQRLLDNVQLDALAAARPAWGDIVRFFKAQRLRLRARSRVDYPALLADAAELFANYDDVRASIHGRFTHVLVDDAQELSLVQQRLLHFLAGFPEPYEPYRSLVVAADPDSAIETFRGAEPEWIDDFGKEFGDHESVNLSTCYRLAPEAGGKVSGLVVRNGARDHRPKSFAGKAEIMASRFPSFAAEVDAIARHLRHAHLEEHVPYEEMAILLTSPRSMLPPLERALDALEVPFSISAPDRPLGREPIVRAFADLARFSFDDDDGAERVAELLRSPLIDLDDGSVREIERIARLRGVTLTEVLNDPPADIDGGLQARDRIAELLTLRDLVRAKKDAPADEAFWLLWDRSRLCSELRDRARRSLDDPAHRDLDALVAFSRALGRFVERRRGRGTLVEYLDAMSRADFGSDPWLPPERSGGGVSVVSFHGAKGRQWAIVAVAGVVEGSIPKGRRATGLFDPYFLDETDPVQRWRRNEAEDRRVFHVAVTRATKRCIVTTSPGPSRRGEPSRFIEELFGSVPEIEMPTDAPPLTFTEAAANYRRSLADNSAPRAERVAALAAIARTCELDPTCATARPSEWWWRWDWTEGAVPIRAQHGAAPPRAELGSHPAGSGTRATAPPSVELGFRPSGGGDSSEHSDDELPSDKLRTSYSRISIYDNCGLQYLCSVVLGLDPETSHNMAFGSVVHKVFEELETGAIPVEPSAAYARFDELFNGIAGQFPNRAMARQFHRDGQLMIERYGKYLKPGHAAKAETKFEVDFNGNVITGRIDRIDKLGRNIVISDYKTSSSPIGWDEARESLQLAIYYLAARNDPEIAAMGEPTSMQLIYPKPPLSRNDVQKRCQTPEEAEVVLERLPALIEGVMAEDFRPHPEADCTWCKFKPLCPLWSEGKELPA